MRIKLIQVRMKDIAIYGSCGFGRDLFCLINNHINKGEWKIIGFFDDTKPKGAKERYGVILGGIEELNNWSMPIDVVIAIGSSNGRKIIRSKITNPNISFPNIIMPDIFYYDKDSVILGEGNIIAAKCSIGSDVYVGSFNVMNGLVSLGHDVRMGDFNSLMPKTQISGNVTMGDMNQFGLASMVIEKVKIGNGISLGAGSLLLNKTKDNATYIGNPAKKFDY